MTKAVYPGSFDPLTNGHLDIIERSIKIFDHLIITIGTNPRKNFTFTTEERVEMIKEALNEKKLPVERITIDSFDGLLVSYLKKVNSNIIVRGLRAITDFEYEFQFALMNKNIDDNIETVFFTTRDIYSFISSSVVKEVVSFGGDMASYIPKVVNEYLKRKFPI